MCITKTRHEGPTPAMENADCRIILQLLFVVDRTDLVNPFPYGYRISGL